MIKALKVITIQTFKTESLYANYATKWGFLHNIQEGEKWKLQITVTAKM